MIELLHQQGIDWDGHKWEAGWAVRYQAGIGGAITTRPILEAETEQQAFDAICKALALREAILALAQPIQ